MQHDYYPLKDPPHILEIHLRRCIDYLRQTIMSNLDISPMKVEWTIKFNILAVTLMAYPSLQRLGVE